jgi:hypothetical protein
MQWWKLSPASVANAAAAIYVATRVAVSSGGRHHCKVTRYAVTS